MVAAEVCKARAAKVSADEAYACVPALEAESSERSGVALACAVHVRAVPLFA